MVKESKYSMAIRYFCPTQAHGAKAKSKVEESLVCKFLLPRLNGNCYEGNFKSGEFSGFGKMTFAANHPFLKSYTGHFDENQFHGWGELWHLNDEEYKGEFKNGKKHGNGQMVYATTGNAEFVSYRGQWEEDEFNGIGALV